MFLIFSHNRDSQKQANVNKTYILKKLHNDNLFYYKIQNGKCYKQNNRTEITLYFNRTLLKDYLRAKYCIPFWLFCIWNSIKDNCFFCLYSLNPSILSLYINSLCQSDQNETQNNNFHHTT